MEIFFKIQNLRIILIKSTQFQSQNDFKHFGLSADGFRHTGSKLHGMK